MNAHDITYDIALTLERLDYGTRETRRSALYALEQIERNVRDLKREVLQYEVSQYEV